MIQTVVRRASVHDLRAIATINTSEFRGSGDEHKRALRWVRDHFASSPAYQYFIAQLEDGTIVGYIGWELHGGYGRSRPVVELEQIAVATEFRRKGIATQLIEKSRAEVVEWIQRDNPNLEESITVIVWAYSENLDAMRVYLDTFADGVQGTRIQYDERTESMLRSVVPIGSEPKRPAL